LSDVVAGTTRLLAEGSTELRAEPRWSPVDDALLYPGPDGGAVYENLEVGSTAILEGVTWPVRFDATGTVAFTWDFDARGQAGGGETMITDLATGVTEATLDGLAGYAFAGTDNVYVVAATNGGFVAALRAPAGCDGVGIYTDSSLVSCLDGVGGASVSPDASRVAFARRTDTRQMSFNGLEREMLVYEIAFLDVASGEETVVASEAVSSVVPPHIEWEDETQLLVRWPRFGGL
jgi:hypothetical protein